MPYEDKRLLWDHAFQYCRTFAKHGRFIAGKNVADTVWGCPACFKQIQGKVKFRRHITATSCFSNKGALCCVCNKSDCSVPYEDKTLLWKHLMSYCRPEPGRNVTDLGGGATEDLDSSQYSCPACPASFVIRTSFYSHVMKSRCFNRSVCRF